MATLNDKELNTAQVIQALDNGKVRIYKITGAHIGDNDDPLTTIYIEAEDYQDVDG